MRCKILKFIAESQSKEVIIFFFLSTYVHYIVIIDLSTVYPYIFPSHLLVNVLYSCFSKHLV